MLCSAQKFMIGYNISIIQYTSVDISNTGADIQLPQNDLRPAYVSDKNADFVGLVALIKTIFTFFNI